MKNKSGFGGKRAGAGRPRGSQNKATLEKRKVEAGLEQRILGIVDRLFNAQVTIALGASFLYRIDEVKEGKHSKKVHTLVTSESEIKAYLDGELDDDAYHYITTEKPDSKSIDSLFDRTFGKAIQKNELDITTKGEKIEGFNYLTPNGSNDKANV